MQRTITHNTPWIRYKAVDFLQNIHKGHPYLTRQGAVWSAFCGFGIWSILCLSFYKDVYNVMLYWVAL